MKMFPLSAACNVLRDLLLIFGAFCIFTIPNVIPLSRFFQKIDLSQSQHLNVYKSKNVEISRNVTLSVKLKYIMRCNACLIS